jgi:hypothetical protein
LSLTDRVIATLACLRLQLPHAAVALLYQVDRSTIARAVGEIRPLLAARGFARTRQARTAATHPRRRVRLRNGRLLWCGAIRPGRMHDVTALRTEGVEDLLRCSNVRARVDSGYQGLARDFLTRSAHHRRNHRKRPATSCGPNTPLHVNPSPHNGAASSMPSPSPGSGGPCAPVVPELSRDHWRVDYSGRTSRQVQPSSLTYVASSL